METSERTTQPLPKPSNNYKKGKGKKGNRRNNYTTLENGPRTLKGPVNAIDLEVTFYHKRFM